jgi:hypothetical protein
LEQQLRRMVAKCPKCGLPNAYTESRFSAENDHGYWVGACSGCRAPFSLKLLNPKESVAEFKVVESGEGRYAGNAPPVVDIAFTDIPPYEVQHRFDYDAFPIHWCQAADESLEASALDALKSHLPEIVKHYRSAQAYALKGRLPDMDHVVVRMPVACRCGGDHQATFYARFLYNLQTQTRPEDYLLAGISGCDLGERLEGLYTKTEIMAALEKLVIRWHLTAEQILVAAPFIGHQYLNAQEKMDIWTWLIRILDPGRAVLVTRSAEFTSYKKLLSDLEGLAHDLLKEFSLEAKLVSANTTKQDFHAKFFIGLSSAACEVLSGSANLVNGKSIENISFRSMEAVACRRRFLDKLNKSLPEPKPMRPDFVLVEMDGNGKWGAKPVNGPKLA